jgi:hypothetical protein
VRRGLWRIYDGTRDPFGNSLASLTEMAAVLRSSYEDDPVPLAPWM